MGGGAGLDRVLLLSSPLSGAAVRPPCDDDDFGTVAPPFSRIACIATLSTTELKRLGGPRCGDVDELYSDSLIRCRAALSVTDRKKLSDAP